jgi:hypothetical protein
MINTFKILFVDDDKRYAEPLIDRAYSEHNIELEHHDNWEEALTCLDEQFDNYKAIIIDGKGRKTKESKGDDIGHVVQALNDLCERKGKGKYIPYAVLSKYIEIKGLIDPTIFFEKLKDENALFEYLMKKILESDVSKIRIKYTEAFEAIGDKYLNQECAENLIEVFKEFENNTWSRNSFTPLRKIIESVYKSLHNYDDNLLPSGCLRFENGQVNFKFCELRLTGQEIREHNSARILYAKINPIFPKHIGSMIGPITKTCSEASHTDEGIYTKYSLGMILFTIVDLLIWYKKFVDEKYF